MTTFIKDPDARLDYGVDWTAWLNGDTITASEWIVAAGLTADTPADDGEIATIWLSGGTAGTDYEATSRITTAAGRIDDRTITIRCYQK